MFGLAVMTVAFWGILHPRPVSWFVLDIGLFGSVLNLFSDYLSLLETAIRVGQDEAS